MGLGPHHGSRGAAGRGTLLDHAGNQAADEAAKRMARELRPGPALTRQREQQLADERAAQRIIASLFRWPWNVTALCLGPPAAWHPDSLHNWCRPSPLERDDVPPGRPKCGILFGSKDVRWLTASTFGQDSERLSSVLLL